MGWHVPAFSPIVGGPRYRDPALPRARTLARAHGSRFNDLLMPMLKVVYPSPE